MSTVHDLVKELHVLASYDDQVQQWYAAFCQSGTTLKDANDPISHHQIDKSPPKSFIAQAQLPSEDLQLANEKSKLMDSYRTFQNKAKSLLRDLRLLQSLQSRKGLGKVDYGQQDKLRALADGRITTVLRDNVQSTNTASKSTYNPESARAVAQRMKAEPSYAFSIVISDLEAMIPWLKSIWQDATPLDEDTLRELLLKRITLMKAALPESLEHHADAALMHMEHEKLQRRYVNEETMYGDSVAEIARDKFLVTEDNYAW
jgi:uncharacterized protein YukE